MQLSSERRQQLSLLEKKIGFVFNDVALLNRAFCHRSYCNEVGLTEDNERLEFLGDSILNMTISLYLYQTFINKDEGELSKLKAFLVSEESLAKSALELELFNYLLMGRGERQSGGVYKKAILADAMEALLAVIYLDLGFEVCRGFIIKVLANQIVLVSNHYVGQDYKTLLQEYCQKKYKKLPIYRIIAESGPDHNKIFVVEVLVNEQIKAEGQAGSKKEAERLAAEGVYKMLTGV